MGQFGSGIKSIQRGVYSGAGADVEISAVVMAKTIVLSKGKSSAGYVAARGDITGTLSPTGGDIATAATGGAQKPGAGTFPTYAGTRTLSGGTTDLIVKHYDAILKDTTHITCDGPCEWQVIEYF
jgi:hypothetical protein